MRPCLLPVERSDTWERSSDDTERQPLDAQSLGLRGFEEVV